MENNLDVNNCDRTPSEVSPAEQDNPKEYNINFNDNLKEYVISFNDNPEEYMAFIRGIRELENIFNRRFLDDICIRFSDPQPEPDLGYESGNEELNHNSTEHDDYI